jgi:hypothetical protein
MLAGATDAEPRALEGTQAGIPPAEAYPDAQLRIVVTYPEWRLRRKRN